MFAHGYNHVFRGGKIEGTGRFESLGMKPGKLHAWLASLTELTVGPMLIFGFLTPLAAAGVVGVMLVALITNHLKNGFFIFRPGQGYEYVLTLTCVGLATGALGAGECCWQTEVHRTCTGPRSRRETLVESERRGGDSNPYRRRTSDPAKMPYSPCAARVCDVLRRPPRHPETTLKDPDLPPKSRTG